MDPRLHAFHEILLELWINGNNSVTWNDMILSINTTDKNKHKKVQFSKY